MYFLPLGRLVKGRAPPWLAALALYFMSYFLTCKKKHNVRAERDCVAAYGVISAQKLLTAFRANFTAVSLARIAHCMLRAMAEYLHK